MKRIIDKQGLFLRDDTQWNEETEIALEVEPNNEGGFVLPQWNGQEWVEGATEFPIAQPSEPTLEERLEALEQMELERMLGL
jgi:hypothetical protein